MVSINALLAVVPNAIKDAMDKDALEYLGEVIADETDSAAVREAAEPFLVDAGMTESELDSMFSRLNLSAAGNSNTASSSVSPSAIGGQVAVPADAGRLPQPLALKDGVRKPSSTSTPVNESKPASSASQPETGQPKQPASATKKKAKSATIAMPQVQAYSQQS
ncbi:hypothetical protein GGF39_004173, partial [Coemansia sp. RSA 1721]